METVRVSECCQREVEPSAYRCTHCEAECKVSEFNSDKIKYLIEPGSIEWEMDWSQKKADGSRQYPDKPEKEMMFEREPALALLLINGVIHINNHWWKKDWPEQAKKATYLGVCCNDIFSWGTAESVEIDVEEIQELYQMFRDDPVCGSTLWCMKKRREMPQTPVADMMRKAGIDLDAFKKDHNLRINFYDGFGLALHKIGMKYNDEGYTEFRTKWIKDNGWESEAE